jgi:RNA polymerase sigma-70 factor (ECF subfamily)
MHDGMVIFSGERGPTLLDGMKRAGETLADTVRKKLPVAEDAPPAAMPEDDDRLLAEIAEGSNAAFARLMERHLGRVFSLALRVTGSRADAEDAAQEAFARVWRKAPDWQAGEARFSTWLYRVTMNLCIDARRRPRAEQLDPDLPLADPGAGTVEMMIDREREQQVQAAMAALPERQREAMALCYTLGLSNAAAAETMEISVKAYEALLVRAKREIRARLEGSES